jgi:HSP20 family protein
MTMNGTSSPGASRRRGQGRYVTVQGIAIMTEDTAWTPNTDIFETESELVIKMEIPGIGKEDIEISLEDQTLLVRGQRRDVCHSGKCCYRQLEIEYGPFEREIKLPKNVDGSKVRANYHNGFLHIVFLKVPAGTPEPIRVFIDHE